MTNWLTLEEASKYLKDGQIHPLRHRPQAECPRPQDGSEVAV
jgi:hypothetical protein